MILISTPDAQAIMTWATAIATLIILVRQQLAVKVNQNTNDLVNGQHGTALNTIATQAIHIASLTGTTVDAQKAADATKAADDHAASTLPKANA